jgi:hypothetical protein
MLNFYAYEQRETGCAVERWPNQSISSTVIKWQSIKIPSHHLSRQPQDLQKDASGIKIVLFFSITRPNYSLGRIFKKLSFRYPQKRIQFLLYSACYSFFTFSQKLKYVLYPDITFHEDSFQIFTSRCFRTDESTVYIYVYTGILHIVQLNTK